MGMVSMLGMLLHPDILLVTIGVQQVVNTIGQLQSEVTLYGTK